MTQRVIYLLAACAGVMIASCIGAGLGMAAASGSVPAFEDGMLAVGWGICVGLIPMGFVATSLYDDWPVMPNTRRAVTALGAVYFGAFTVSGITMFIFVRVISFV